LLTEIPPEKRALVTASTGATAALAAAAGPTLGSLLISAESWRWVFYVNLPVAVIALVAGTRVLVERRDPAPATLPDALGVALIVGAVGLVSLGIIERPAAIGAGPTPASSDRSWPASRCSPRSSAAPGAPPTRSSTSTCSGCARSPRPTPRCSSSRWASTPRC
jgi:MFS family permease